MVMLGQHSKRMVILAEGRLSSTGLRLVIAPLLYIPERVVAVIDSSKAGHTTQEAIGLGGETPIVSSVEEAMQFSPDSLLIGIMPLTGLLPTSWIALIQQAIESGLHIISGLKYSPSEDESLRELTRKYDVEIYDLRTVSRSHLIRAQGSWRRRNVRTILTVGTDSNTGKMTTALMIHREMRSRGINAVFVGSGPTGILISGRGVSVGAVRSDFLEGAIEFEVDRAANEGCEYVIVEGQSAITNSGNSAIAMGLLHGVMPDAMILCHEPSRKTDGFGLPLPSLNDSRHLHEQLLGLFKPSKVIGIGLNSMGLNKEELRMEKDRILEETGLHACDPLRESPTQCVDIILDYFDTYKQTFHHGSSGEIHDRTY